LNYSTRSKKSGKWIYYIGVFIVIY
jgi:hypothetical protein